MFPVVFQLPVGPEVAMILLVAIVLTVPGVIVLAVLAGIWRRNAAEEADRAERIQELDRRVEELESE